MYENLIGLMAIRKIAKTTMSTKMDMNRGTLDNKLNGKSKFTVSEMYFIQHNFFSDVDMDYLFAKTDKTAWTGLDERRWWKWH